jgi:hypothetical protein
VQTLASVELNAPPMVLPSPEPVLSAAPLTVEGASALIEGHWILTRAGVWTEDIEPLWTGRGLEFSGTVESSARQRQISELLARAAGSRTFAIYPQIIMKEKKTATLLTTYGIITIHG